MGCRGCGGKSGVSTDSMESVTTSTKELGVLLEYIGPRVYPFDVTGGVSRLRYHIPKRFGIVELGGVQGINPVDVRWFLAVNRGRDYAIYEPAPEPDPAPAPEPAPTPEPEPDEDEDEDEPLTD